MANFLLPIIRQGNRAFELHNSRNGQVVAQTVVPAFDSDARRKGLLGRDSFPDGSAMIIAPSNAIHTFWMRFAIDVVFVRRDGVVVKVQESLLPWRAAVSVKAYAVIELRAGALRQIDLKVGDVVALALSSDVTNERCEPGRLIGTDAFDQSLQVHSAQRV